MYAFVFCIFGLTIAAVIGPVVLNVDIPPKTWKAARLRNLPQGAVVSMMVKSDGEIAVAIVDTAGYLRYPKPQRPLFLGRVTRRLSFSVTIPATDNYYAVFDNRMGQQSRAVTITVGASRDTVDQTEAATNILRTFEQQLHKIFVFDPISMSVKQCGKPKAFVETPDIILCAEYIQHLYTGLGDKQKAQDALSFSIFHELSRVLLAQWQHPSAAKKVTADEFATVLMVMLNQTKRLMSAAEHFARKPSDATALMKLLRDDRHPLSSKRGRKILRWLKNPQQVLKWQPFLVPHMQTNLLRKLQQNPTEWTDLKLVEKELAQRRKLTPITPPDKSPGTI